MRDWRPSEYPTDPFVCVTAHDQAGSAIESAQLMTDSEIDTFFNRVIFELKVLPKTAEESRKAAKHELALQQARIRRA